jgi:predicted transcriptional regulator
MKQICIQLPAESVARLERLAKQARRSRSNLARAVLEAWLERPRPEALSDVLEGPPETQHRPRARAQSEA